MVDTIPYDEVGTDQPDGKLLRKMLLGGINRRIGQYMLLPTRSVVLKFSRFNTTDRRGVS